MVGSNLTAVELSGLTRVELSFALLLAAAASGLGLALGLGFRERPRAYAIAVALGARRAQLGGFVWGESAFVTQEASRSARSWRPRSPSCSSTPSPSPRRAPPEPSRCAPCAGPRSRSCEL